MQKSDTQTENDPNLTTKQLLIVERYNGQHIGNSFSKDQQPFGIKFKKVYSQMTY